MREPSATGSRTALDLFTNDLNSNAPSSSHFQKQSTQASLKQHFKPNAEQPSTPDTNTTKDTSSHLIQPPLLHIHLKQQPPALLPTSTTQPSSNNPIQTVLNTYTHLPDAQRLQLLKGLIGRCSSKEVEWICTALNLKSLETRGIGAGKLVFQEECGRGKFGVLEGAVGVGAGGKKKKSKEKGMGRLPQLPQIQSGNGGKVEKEEQQQHQGAGGGGPPVVAVAAGIQATDSLDDFNPNAVQLPSDHYSQYHQDYIFHHHHHQNHHNSSTSTTTFNAPPLNFSPAPAPPTQPHPNPSQWPHLNPNLYIKLLNTTSNPDLLLSHLRASKTPLETSKTLLQFLSGRCKKLQGMLDCMADLAKEGDGDKGMERLFGCVKGLTGGKWGALYIIDEATGGVRVRMSDWRVAENSAAGKGSKPGTTEGGGDSVSKATKPDGAPVSDKDKKESKADNTVKPLLQLTDIIGAAQVLKSLTPLSVYNLPSSDLYTDTLHDQYKHLEPQCSLLVPIKVESGSKCTGFIEIINKAPFPSSSTGPTMTTPPYFSAEDEFCLTTLASLWTLLLSQTHVRQQALRKSDDIRVLLNTASLMSSELDLGDLIRVIMQTAQELLNAERCALFMIDKQKGELWSSLAQGAGEIRVPMGKGIAGHVATTGEVLNIPDAYHDKRFNRSVDMKTGFRTRDILCMPMRNTQGEVIGVTQIINKLPAGSGFSKEDELLLMAFSSLAAVTIEKSILFKALQVTLQETSQTKEFLNRILQSITNVVITLDPQGRLLTVNHPAKLELTTEFLDLMRATSFEHWLGREENGTLVADIQRVYRGEGTVMATDYELKLKGREGRNVNYTVVEMTADGGGGIGIATPPMSAGGDVISQALSGSKPSSRNGGGLMVDNNSLKARAKSSEVLSVEEANEKNKNEASSNAKKSSTNTTSTAGGERKVKGVVIVIEDISKEKRVMNTLGRYMNPALVNKVMSDSGKALGGARQKISVVFADLRNFTNLSESLDPSEVVSLLNMHYTSVVDSILSEQGILDKYIGDAAMAVFGVPYTQADDALRSVAAAIKMKAGLEALNRRNRIMRLPTLKMGIGISTGLVLSGNIGSPKRMEYTVIGEAVNIASRIENMTKLYGTMILICDKTQQAVRDKFHLREVDSIVVKGKTVPVVIYEVLGSMETELPQEQMTSLICYELGLAEYRNQNWSIAITHFKKAIQINDDGPSKTMLERCKGILDGLYEVPPTGWDGCWKFTEK
ncbi:hypothetical protein HDV05_006936 [Chytridiales sp. JEL 0842]|nr:hypothetical protein HDV05_006936 [Chytridiales sp. JEL 0842]